LFADIAEPIIISGTKKVRWPLSFAMEEGAFMRVVACGMPYSPLAARATSVGCHHGILSSAVGKAYLANCSANERQAAICAAAVCKSTFTEASSFKDEIHEIKRLGFATRFGSQDDINSAFAVPVRSTHTVFGSLACSTSKRSFDKMFIAGVFEPVMEVARQLADALDQCKLEC
jgi:IclR family mhp operon transcriptional activator